MGSCNRREGCWNDGYGTIVYVCISEHVAWTHQNSCPSAVARQIACVMLVGVALAAAFSLPPVGHRALQQRGQCSSISMMAPPPSSFSANSGKLTKLPDLYVVVG